MLRRLVGLLIVSAAAISGALMPAAAFPTKPIVIVVPFPAGAGPDVVARLLGERLSPRLGQPVIIENRPGASGYVGAAAVARAAPDGHTLLLTPNTLFIAPHLAPKATTAQVHVVNDFAPVIMPSQTTMVMVANPGLGVRNAKELADLVRKQPGLAYGSSGNGSVLHIAGELFKRAGHLDMQHVPYKGITPAIADVIAGHVKVTFAGLSIANFLKSGALLALATVEKQRSAALPDLPTAIEQGFPDVAVEGWFALVAPKATPGSVIERLNRELNAVLAMPDVRDRIVNSGEIVLGGTPETLGRRMQDDYDRYGSIVKQLNIKSD